MLFNDKKEIVTAANEPYIIPVSFKLKWTNQVVVVVFYLLFT